MTLQRREFLKSLPVLAAASTVLAAEKDTPSASGLTMVVMDPLSSQLSCDCVKGYAQRDYKKLAAFLEKTLGQPVSVFFGESLKNTLDKKSNGKADIIIGKESVVRITSKENKIDATPIASLTGKDGKTTIQGWIVVAGQDPVVSAADLKEHKILFGPTESVEKHDAAIALLKDLEVKLPATVETCPSCSNGATKVVDAFKKNEKLATVISSYAAPILEGCGTIQKGDLKVIGKTDDVPFIVAFVNNQLSKPIQEQIQKALFEVSKNPDLVTALETKDGFVAIPSKKK